MTGLNVTSQWREDARTGRETIDVFRQELYGCTDIQKIKKDIAHEIGHSVYSKLTSEEKENYKEICTSNEKDNIYSKIKTRGLEEDFCYVYSLFFLDKDNLLTGNKVKYDFMNEICARE